MMSLNAVWVAVMAAVGLFGGGFDRMKGYRQLNRLLEAVQRLTEGSAVIY